MTTCNSTWKIPSRLLKATEIILREENLLTYTPIVTHYNSQQYCRQQRRRVKSPSSSAPSCLQESFPKTYIWQGQAALRKKVVK
ncbi:hypothetical protein M404DRAFT_526454 [Pisolithus tinctorius Marx 270]|uniref:Uncharacterized protein n=1 Tax=Pisolithus tinctorius Marx 270 TaxID=870435 RepID=A0A0C3K733_PISTI|nr:hypothetical protein M404DRAFT_526454 [Pisolithus tinctorius Marx 270]